MELENLGYNQALENYRKEHNLDAFEIGRVISQHKDRYDVKAESGDLDCELIGNLRFTITDKNELPAVGDWVAISEYDEGKALIHAVLPRTSVLERKAVAKKGQTQIIATNIDVGLIVQSVNRDFNINRIQRYLTICNATKIDPIIVLSKIDLIEENELENLLNQITDRIKNIPVYPISCTSQFGIPALKSIFSAGKTYCLLGSSGVGKSTLINTITGQKLMDTGEISESIDRGKHITTHRELIVFESGVLIDNPGMREVGITATSDGLEMTFDEISELAQNCKFKDCSHTNETNCAVIEALENGTLDADSYENYLRMEREKAHFESSVSERKKKDKDLGKLIKNMKKQNLNNKY